MDDAGFLCGFVENQRVFFVLVLGENEKAFSMRMPRVGEQWTENIEFVLSFTFLNFLYNFSYESDFYLYVCK